MTNIVSEVAKLARLQAIAANPTGQDFFSAARQLGVAEAEVASIADLAMHDDLNRPLAASKPGSLKPRADALRAKIAHLEKQAPNGESIASTRAELARVLAIDPAATQPTRSVVPTAPVDSPTPRAFTAALKKVIAAHGIEGAKVSTKQVSFAGFGFGEGATANIDLPGDAGRPSDALMADLEATRQAFCATAGGPSFDPLKEGKRSSFRVEIKVPSDVLREGSYVTTPKDELFCRQAVRDQDEFMSGKITPELLLKPTTGTDGFIITHWAAARGLLDRVPKGMLTRELVIARDNKGSTPLHEAARSGKLHLVPCLKEMLQPGDLNIEDGNRYTPLEFALKSTANGEVHAANLSESFVRSEIALSKDKALEARYEELRGRLWMVEVAIGSGGWDDADWHVDDEPRRFTSQAEAESAIGEFVRDATDAGLDYSLVDFRAVRVVPEQIESGDDVDPLPGEQPPSNPRTPRH